MSRKEVRFVDSEEVVIEGSISDFGVGSSGGGGEVEGVGGVTLSVLGIEEMIDEREEAAILEEGEIEG